MGQVENPEFSALRSDDFQSFLEFRSDTRGLGKRISALESVLVGLEGFEASLRATDQGVNPGLVKSALFVKSVSSQVDVVLHAAGIIAALPFIMQAGEKIEALSLGAGSTDRAFDLETDRQVAEFKFIRWRGADSVRQDNLLIDVFNLDQSQTIKRKVMYLTGAEIPLRWLDTSKRKTRTVLGRKQGAPSQFDAVYGSARYQYVHEYWAAIRESIEVVDLTELVPWFKWVDE